MKFLVLLSMAVASFAMPQQQVVHFQQQQQPQPQQVVQNQYGAAAAIVPQTSIGAVTQHTGRYPFVPSAQFLSQNELGAYNYGYVSGDGHAKNEIRADDGTVAGTYAYLDPNGQPVRVLYSAGPRGFRATGLHLPQSVPLPEANVRAEAAHMAAKAIVAAKEASRAAAANQQQTYTAQTEQQQRQTYTGTNQQQMVYVAPSSRQQQTYTAPNQVTAVIVDPAASARVITRWG